MSMEKWYKSRFCQPQGSEQAKKQSSRRLTKGLLTEPVAYDEMMASTLVYVPGPKIKSPQRKMKMLKIVSAFLRSDCRTQS